MVILISQLAEILAVLFYMQYALKVKTGRRGQATNVIHNSVSPGAIHMELFYDYITFFRPFAIHRNYLIVFGFSKI